MLDVVERPKAELPWTVEQLDMLEVVSKQIGRRQPQERTLSTAALTLIAPERLDPAKAERNIAVLRVSLRSREQELSGNEKERGGLYALYDQVILNEYFEYLFCLSILKPGERYTFELPDVAAKLEGVFETIDLVHSADTIRNLGIFSVVLPDQRHQVADRWAELAGYLDYWNRGIGSENGLLGLRLISPEQFAELGVPIQPVVADLQKKITHEMEWLRRDPEASRAQLAKYMMNVALLSAHQIEFNPQGGLVLEHKSTIPQERPLPERSVV